MSDIIPNGVLVVVTEDEHFEGHFGIIRAFETAFDRYKVDVDGKLIGMTEDQFAVVVVDKDVLDLRNEVALSPLDADAEIETPAFGLSGTDLAHYVRTYVDRAVGRVKRAGDLQFNAKGFQQFEGLTHAEILRSLQEDLEFIAARTAATDILVQRYITALDSPAELPSE